MFISVFVQYVLNIENDFILKGVEGLDIGILKLYFLLYAADIVIFSESSKELQKGLDILADYCDRWKLTVNTDKTICLVFRKGGKLPRNISFTFRGSNIETVSKFAYLGITFTAGGAGGGGGGEGG